MGQEGKWVFSSEGRRKRTELKRRGLPLSLPDIWREDSCSHLARLDSQIPLSTSPDLRETQSKVTFSVTIARMIVPSAVTVPQQSNQLT